MITINFLISSLLRQFLWVAFFLFFYLCIWVCWCNVVYLFEIEIFSLFGCDVVLPLVLDSVRLFFIRLVIIISARVFLFSSSYMSEEIFLSRFIYLVLLFVISMGLLIFIPNMISLLIGWDGLGLVSFLLVIYYQRFYALSGGLVTVIINRLGDVALLLGIGWSLNQGHWMVLRYDFFSYRWCVCILIVIAGITKSAQIPFSRWLPAAIAAPTPVSALVHSSTLVTAGVYLIIRFYNFLILFPLFFKFLLIIGVLTIFIAGLTANLESDIKKVIALSTLSQLGVIMGSLGAGFVDLAFFHLSTHALFKALLFLCAGHFIHIGGHYQDVRIFGQISAVSPVTCVGLLCANLALCGFPFIAGFYSKDLIIEGCARNYFNFFICVIFFVSAGLTAIYSIRISISVLWGLWLGNCYSRIGDDDPFVIFPIFTLFLGAVGAGSYFSWSVYRDFRDFIIPLLIKMNILIFVRLGVFIGIIIWLRPLCGLSFPWLFNRFNWGIIKMWFIVDLNTQFFIRKWITFGGNIIKTIEVGWVEMFTAQGVSYLRLFSINLLKYVVKSIWVKHTISLFLFVFFFFFLVF